MHLWDKRRLHEQNPLLKKMHQSEPQEGEKNARNREGGSHPWARRLVFEKHRERLQFVT